MTLWAKVIDQRKCIGCHACTVACKSEHRVPLGVTRTYVKQVDVGVYPTVRRHFQITRCNQCDNPPCVAICPVGAMFRRRDGIVDFDRDACIGCQSCLAACPYDAIYLDPESHSAEKCNFCAHRIDQGLEPACVAVCPERALVVGDLLDPGDAVAALVARGTVEVRKPEKGTRPKVFYVEASQFTLVPGAAAVPDGHAYAEQREGYPTERDPQPLVRPRADTPGGPADPAAPPGAEEAAATAEVAVVPPMAAGADVALRPSRIDPAKTAAPAVLAYDFPHRSPWDWRVSAYTWTKSVAAGAYLLPALLGLAGVPVAPAWALGSTLVALVFLALTGGLLIFDLHHPERFLNILIRPQWRSWLARGAFIITGYGALLALDAAARIAGWAALPAALRLPGAVLAALAAVYTAFLFAQAKARDLWQNPALPLGLLNQAVLAGAAALLLLNGWMPAGSEADALLARALGAGLGLQALLALGEAVTAHPTRDAARAAHQLTRGAYRGYYWSGVLLDLAGLVAVSAGAAAPAAVLALAGLLLYEHAFVQAGQSVPLS